MKRLCKNRISTTLNLEPNSVITMKIKHSFLPAAMAVVAIILTCAVGSRAYAGPPSVVTKAQSASTILVTVPPNGKPVTYVLGNKVWTVKPGQTAVLPAAATKISLPAGTILKVSIPSAKSMEPTKYAYTVNQPITLNALTPEAIQTNAQFITPGTGTIAGNVQLPTGTMIDLIEAVSSASGTTVDPFNVLHGDVTDGN